MLRTLKKALDIDIAYSVNSFIYVLKKLPIFKDLFTNDVYSSKTIKCIVTIIGLILSLGREIFLIFIILLFLLFLINYFQIIW